MVSEIKINLDEYNGSCDDKTAELELAEEFSPTLQKITKIDEELEKLSKLDSAYLSKKTYLMEKKLEIQRAKNQKRSELQKKQPLVSKLYNLRAASRNGLKEGEKVDSQIQFDNQGNPFLKISKQMDGAVGFDFTITGDGKVVFGAMDDAKMAEVIDFLYRRGITGFELPAGAPKTPEEAQKRAEETKNPKPELDQQTFANRVEEIKNKADQEPDHRYIPAERDDPHYNPQRDDPQINTALNQTTPAMALADEQTTQALAATGAAASSNNEEFSFKDAKKELKNWATKTRGKNEGEGLHINFWGGNTFSFYKDNSQDWYKEDGKKDKKGVRKDLVEFRVELHEKDGKLSGFSYYVANNGKVDPKYAGEMLGLMKKSGMDVINFSEGIPDEDQEIWRKQCAKKGLIPSGCLSLGKTGLKDIKQMIKDNEEQNDGDPSANRAYKIKMGYALEQEVLKDNPPNAAKLAYAKELQKEKDYERMHEFYGPILTDVALRSRSYGPDRVKESAGAANAATVLFELFESHGEKSIPELLNSPDNGLDPEQIAALNRFNTPNNQNLQIQKMSKEAWKEIYLALKVAETQKAEGAVKDTRNTLSDAQKGCNNIIKTLQDKGFTKLVFNFDATKRDTDTPQQTQTNNQPPRTPSNTNAALNSRSAER